ncbi:S8 family peptidase [Rubrobacter marinus]|nr:S8 family peptidase [Rubrobacter marinus]
MVDESPGRPPHVAGELIVSFAPDASSRDKDAAIERVRARTTKRIGELETRLVSFPEIKNERVRENREQALERQRQALERLPIVESVDYNYLRRKSLTPNDPYFRSAPQYGLTKPGFPRAWDRVRGKSIRVAVLDSGIQAGHPEFRGRIAVQRDFVADDATAEDPDGHGTHVAGTIGASTGNGTGVASGAFASSLVIGKFIGADGSGTVANEIDAIVWAVNNGSHVINMSFGAPGYVQAEQDAVTYAANKGVVTVAAAGNANSNVPEYPAAYPNVVSVAATDSSDRRASFSNYGSSVDVAAPGVNIMSTVPGGYARYSGTSMATPHVSSLAALLRNQGKTRATIISRMQSTAVDLGAAGKDPYYGAGRIDAARAVLN